MVKRDIITLIVRALYIPWYSHCISNFLRSSGWSGLLKWCESCPRLGRKRRVGSSIIGIYIDVPFPFKTTVLTGYFAFDLNRRESLLSWFLSSFGLHWVISESIIDCVTGSVEQKSLEQKSCESGSGIFQQWQRLDQRRKNCQPGKLQTADAALWSEGWWSEGWWRVMKDDERSWTMMEDDERWWKMMKDDEGWWSMMKDDEGWWMMMKRNKNYEEE